MGDTKTTGLSAGTPLVTDILDYVSDPAGTPVSKKAAIGDIPQAVVLTGAHGSRPAASKSGLLYLPNDGYSLARDTGAAWTPFGPLYQFTPPVDANFAWLNQGSASVVTTKDAIALIGPGSGNAQNFIGREQVAPATPWTITAYILGNTINKNNHQWGMYLRQAGAGTGTLRIMAFFVGQGASSATVPGSSIFVADSPNPTTTYGTFYASPPIAEPVRWFRINDNGTNTIFSVSGDGVNWTQLVSQSRLTYLLQGPDRVGFFVNTQNAATPNLDTTATVLSWLQQ
jgi:hypothetical protein